MSDFNEGDDLALALYHFRYPGRQTPIKVLLDDCRREVDVILNRQRSYAESADAIERGL